MCFTSDRNRVYDFFAYDNSEKQILSENFNEYWSLYKRDWTVITRVCVLLMWFRDFLGKTHNVGWENAKIMNENLVEL